MAKLSSSNGIEKFPKLRFPEFKEPWNLVKLEDVCSYRKGRAKVKKAQYISTENILQNYAGIEPYDDLSEAEGISIQCGDTLMANIRPYLKKVWQSNFNGACSTDVLAFSPDNIDGKFLYFLIAQDRFVNYVMCGAKGSKMPRGDKNHILEYETGVPTESEQRKIAHFIDLLNARISSQNSLINLIKKYKRGSLSALFPKKREITPQYRFAGFTKPWEQRKASELCSISTGKSNTQDKVEDGEYPFYVRSPIVERSNKYLYDEEAVITVGDGVGTGKVFHYVNGKYDLHQRCYRMFNFSAELNAHYFYHTFSKMFYNRVMAMTAKTSVDSVRLEMIADMEIPTPKIEEQIKIGEYLDNLDNLITLHQHKYDILLSLKNALLQQLFI